jgi:hypothetical protein
LAPASLKQNSIQNVQLFGTTYCEFGQHFHGNPSDINGTQLRYGHIKVVFHLAWNNEDVRVCAEALDAGCKHCVELKTKYAVNPFIFYAKRLSPLAS